MQARLARGDAVSGYTPLFASLTTGTLYGRWPDIGLWPIVLSLADRYGVVDVTPQYLSGITGLPLDEITSCLERFCEPDPYSRSSTEGGRRLVLVDPENRKWGWRIVNYVSYRERARLLAKTARDVESGRNSLRMRGRRTRPQTADDRRGPPLKENHTKQNQTEEKTSRIPPDGGDSPANLDLTSWNRWEAYRREIRKPLKGASVKAAQRKLAELGPEQAAVVEQSIANGWVGLFPLKEGARGKGNSHDTTGTWRPTDGEEGGMFS